MRKKLKSMHYIEEYNNEMSIQNSIEKCIYFMYSYIINYINCLSLIN